jgi:hypothetical protein
MPKRGKTRGKYLSRKARNSIGFDLNRICAKKRKKRLQDGVLSKCLFTHSLRLRESKKRRKEKSLEVVKYFSTAQRYIDFSSPRKMPNNLKKKKTQ